MADYEKILRETSYPGRGIMIGRSADGTKALTAYFIMGRSANSRNRVFVEEGEGIRTEAYDPSKMEDPSLIIYAPVRVYGNKTIVTNGDQTDTIYEGLDKQYTFEQALRSREFEPDAPNYTPRISGVMHVEKGKYSYAMSILKSDQGDPSSCLTRHSPAISMCSQTEYGRRSTRTTKCPFSSALSTFLPANTRPVSLIRTNKEGDHDERNGTQIRM